MSKITIVAATDEKYAMLLNVMAASVLKVAGAEDSYSFKLLIDRNLTTSTLNKLSELKKLHDCSFDFIPIDQNLFSDVPTLQRLSPMTNARLHITSLLPETDRVIYLDCDLILRQNIKALWDFELASFPIAASMDYGSTREELAVRGFRLEDYFNAGVLLLDLNALRNMNFEQEVQAVITKNPQFIHDQDILNGVFRARWQRLSLCWNVQSEMHRAWLNQYSPELRRQFRAAERHPAIVHFSGTKPTSCRFRGRFKREFWQVLRLTAYRDYVMTDCSLYNWVWSRLPNWILKCGSWFKRQLKVCRPH